MTEKLYLTDAYCKTADATVTGLTEDGGIVLSRSLFYPTGGGQPGDSGALSWDGGSVAIATTVKGPAGESVLVPEACAGPLPSPGTDVTQELNWERRYGFMRVHTLLHLLCVVIPRPVTGGSISETKGRLDFDMPDAPEDKDALAAALNTLIAGDADVTSEWITDEELAAQPGLVKTMSVKPPQGAGHVRLVRIGTEAEAIDLQPCGGTHVARLGEIGSVRLGKIEKKGRQNRRVYVHLES